MRCLPSTCQPLHANTDIVFSFINSYGVIQEYYFQHPPLMTQPKGPLAAVSTTATAIMLIGSPFVSLILQRFPNLRRVGGCIGLAIVFLGLYIASATDSSKVVLWSQGVMYGFGALLIYFPAMFLIDEWFVERKGLAFGISWAGTGAGGASAPFLLQWLLHTYGHRITLRICAGIIVRLPLLLSISINVADSRRL
jgi:MFS family permease